MTVELLGFGAKSARYGRLILILLAAAALVVADDDDDRRKRVKELNELSERLNRYATDATQTPERRFLHERITGLLDRSRKEIDNGYRFGRLTSAIDDLLDASIQIENALEDGPSKTDTQERAARELEDTYFDLIRGEHFAKQSGDRSANDYVRVARKLYQHARASYEQELYARARDLGEAAREVVDGLESLAQVEVRVPTPPKL